MSSVYRFRITFEDYDVSRDIEIKSTQTFEDFHLIIQSSINFDASKPASFFISTDHWIRGQEISSEEKTDKAGNKILLLKEARLANFIADPHQKIYYQFDNDTSWTFLIELVKILPQADGIRHYPVCVKTSGDAPKQYKITSPPKNVLAEDDELDKLMMGNAPAAVIEEDDTEEESDNLREEAEEGVEENEIDGMGEEGEEEEKSEDDEEMGFADGEEDEKQSGEF